MHIRTLFSPRKFLADRALSALIFLAIVINSLSLIAILKPAVVRPFAPASCFINLTLWFSACLFFLSTLLFAVISIRKKNARLSASFLAVASFICMLLKTPLFHTYFYLHINRHLQPLSIRLAFLPLLLVMCIMFFQFCRRTARSIRWRIILGAALFLFAATALDQFSEPFWYRYGYRSWSYLLSSHLENLIEHSGCALLVTGLFLQIKR